jgi:hypothetical protein
MNRAFDQLCQALIAAQQAPRQVAALDLSQISTHGSSHFQVSYYSPQTKYHEPLLRWNFVLKFLKIYYSHEKQRQSSYALGDIANIHFQGYEMILGPPHIIELGPLHLWLAFADSKLH